VAAPVTLAARRQLASAASGGTSNDAIYHAIFRVLGALDLHGDVLDFGAGKGVLTEQLRQAGHFRSVTAVDIMARPPQLHATVTWHRGDLNEPVTLAGDTFDVIVAAEVIEHLENPRAVARECFRLLRPRGTLILTTPNNESWRSLGALLTRGHFAAFLDGSYPAHLSALLRKDLGRILTEAGFQAPAFAFSDLGMIPRSRLTWQAISRGRLIGLRYSDNLLALALKP
jgi:2-polyprenyl-3-methyl-5-hydroxy-6-metoxy-1,4-benzoquinol methylase